MSSLNREHLDMIKISKTLTDYLLKEEKSLNNFFRECSLKKDYFTVEDLQKMMEKIGYYFSIDQVEELYAYIDKDNDNKLYFDELNEEIYN